MKRFNYYGVILLLALSISSTGLTAKTLEKLTITNTTAQFVFVSWFYNQDDLGTFLVALPAGKSVSVNNWKIDQPTKLFIGGKSTAGYKGNLYTITEGKIVDVEIKKQFEHPKIEPYFYPAARKHFFRSSKLALTNDEIFVQLKKAKDDFLNLVLLQNRFNETALIEFTLNVKDNYIKAGHDQKRLQGISDTLVVYSLAKKSSK